MPTESSLPVPPPKLGPLSPRESKELLRLESIIDKGLCTFLEVGRALVTIRESLLYREQFDSFDDYCRARWGMSKTHANRLIASAATVEAIGDVPTLPANEAQVRPLTLLPAEQQAEAWKRAVEASGSLKKVTAAMVSQVVEDMLAEGKGQVVQRRPKQQVRFVDRDRLVQDLLSFCEKHHIPMPRRVVDFLRKY